MVNFNPMSYSPNSQLSSYGMGNPAAMTPSNSLLGQSPDMSAYTQMQTSGYGAPGAVDPSAMGASMGTQPMSTNDVQQISLLTEQTKQVIENLKEQTIAQTQDLGAKRKTALDKQRNQDQYNFSHSFTGICENQVLPDLGIIGSTTATGAYIGSFFPPWGGLIGAGIGTVVGG